jgi:hypothetical protein
METGVARIYISATYSDLKECREAVYRALRSMKHDVIAMEDYVAADERSLDKCLADVASCDLYVGVFAWRYGYVPPKGNRGKKSITELEYRHAVRKGIPCLIFLLHEKALWPREQMEGGEGAEKLQRLREELRTKYNVSFFESCGQLATQASAAVVNLLKEREREEREREEREREEARNNLRDSPPAERVSISRLPVTGENLFGRDERLRQLDEAWDDRETHVLSLVAWGGVGKSTLVNHWLARMGRDDYRGAERVYG